MLSKPSSLSILLLGPVVSVTAHSDVYLTEQQAVELLFPLNSLQEKLEKSLFTLEAADIIKIKDLSPDELKIKKITLWKNKNHNRVYIDQVTGKHELITYAVGFEANGKIKGIEILEYREAYGQKIRDLNWRKQFVDKDKSSQLKVGRDIKNISGSTISSTSITNGVKRLTITDDLIKDRL